MIFSVFLGLFYTRNKLLDMNIILVSNISLNCFYFFGNDCGSNNHQMMSRNAWDEEENNEKLIHQHKMECWGFGRERRLNELTILWVSLCWNKYTTICFLWFIVDYIKLSWNITLQEQQNISMPSFYAEILSENDSVSSYCVETLAKTHETQNIISFKLFWSELCFELSHMCGKMSQYCEMSPKYYRYSTHNPISCSGMKHCCYWDMKTEIDIDIQLLFVNSIVNKS